ncbi:MAG: glycosyltransferase family 4 protein [Pirellulales bacterium]|nr:glycosyltransferase family 4 protein [Pirellulales bacterium]
MANLIRALSRCDESNDYLLYYDCRLFQGNRSFLHNPSTSNFQPRPVRCPMNAKSTYPNLWWNHWLPWITRRDRLDVFHGPNFFLPANARFKSVVTIHDLAFFKMQLYTPGITEELKSRTLSAVRRADRVIAISQHTRDDLSELGVNLEKIRTVYSGGNIVPDERIRSGDKKQVRDQYRLPEKYVLYVGTLHPRKNIPLLLHAFARMKHSGNIPHGLVLAGLRSTAGDEIDRLVGELKIGGDVVITGYVEDWQLPHLYRMADLFVLPSKYEGFGMIIVEAMAYGVPVIATDTSCISEVLGDAGVLVPPDNVDKLVAAMQALIQSPQSREDFVRRGLEQAKAFTWERCAIETISVYEDAYHSSDCRDVVCSS